jgi:UDP-3-O-[3-hydroxymyristoyl] glucosamine N-acyltransferase
VILHSGVRVGSDGFGYVQKQVDGELVHVKIPHIGRAIIGNDVEIGANTAIDRGSVDDTVIGDGTKIDNLVHIGHNVRIGRLCLLMAQVGIAGSARIEDGVIMGGHAAVTGHVTIGAWARLAGKSGAISDVPAGETWSGYPARPHKEALRSSAALLKLPALLRRIEKLLEQAKL